MKTVFWGKFTIIFCLFLGQYYDFDSNPDNGHHDSVMSSQLDGHWFLKASGLEDNSVSIKPFLCPLLLLG